MNRKQRATLAKIFAKPARSDLRWSDIETLLLALGASMEEGGGSRVRFDLNGERAVFHRPHQPETDKGALMAVRRFLEQAGVRP